MMTTTYFSHIDVDETVAALNKAEALLSSLDDLLDATTAPDPRLLRDRAVIRHHIAVLELEIRGAVMLRGMHPFDAIMELEAEMWDRHGDVASDDAVDGYRLNAERCREHARRYLETRAGDIPKFVDEPSGIDTTAFFEDPQYQRQRRDELKALACESKDKRAAAHYLRHAELYQLAADYHAEPERDEMIAYLFRLPCYRHRCCLTSGTVDKARYYAALAEALMLEGEHKASTRYQKMSQLYADVVQAASDLSDLSPDDYESSEHWTLSARFVLAQLEAKHEGDERKIHRDSGYELYVRCMRESIEAEIREKVVRELVDRVFCGLA